MEQGTTHGTTKMRGTFWRRHRWLKWFGICCLAFLVVVIVAAVIVARRAEPFLRAVIVERLQERFHARVELDSFHISIAEGLRADGKGLRIWPPAQVAGMASDANPPGKPLIQLAEFRFRAPLRYATNEPLRISRIELRGLTIDIPPGPHFLHGSESESPGSPSPANAQAAGPHTPGHIPGPVGAQLLHFTIETVICRDAHLTLESSNPAKQPLEFDIQSLKVTHFAPNGSMDFAATLTNPLPRGTVNTTGSLGPWTVEDPGMTPIQGNYSFDHADLGTFKSIEGTLDSTGNYKGVLRKLAVDGEADTPNFALSNFGTAMPLHTVFHANVDATNGDTWLDPVEATLGHTHFIARGKVVELKPVPAAKGSQGHGNQGHPGGHEITLNVDVQHGNIADFLRLATHNGDPMLTGDLQMKTSLNVPPGHNPVHERMELKGTFHLDNAQFTNPKIQQHIAELSMRGQGKPKEAKSGEAAAVRSAMQSDFTMADGVVTLPNLIYTVPGAEIDLAGTYTIDGGGLAFRGSAKTQATVSQMVGGWKGLLLKPADRFFKKEGAGTKVGVHVYGTRTDPHFGIDF